MATPTVARSLVSEIDFASQHRSLQPGPAWTSFEQFRKGGDQSLRQVKPGEVGTLRTKSGVYRVLNDEDFQALVGLASEVDRLRSNSTMLAYAVQVVRENPSSESAKHLLLHILGQYQSGPALPARRGNEPWKPEQIPFDPDDEFILDPVHLAEPAEKR